MRESDLILKIRKYIQSVGGKSIKIHMNEYMEVGTPDILAGIPGIGPIFIEAKVPGERPSKIQEIRLAQWRDVQFITGWADSVEKAKEIIHGQGGPRGENQGGDQG